MTLEREDEEGRRGTDRQRWYGCMIWAMNERKTGKTQD